MVFPIVRLSSPGPGQWRGTLAPRDRDAWFKRYGELLGELGAVAGVTGATRLVVGSELSSLDGRPRPLAAAGRAHARDLLGQARLFGQLGSLPLDRLCSTWSTRRGSRATSTCGTRRPRPTTRRWRRAGGGPGARSTPGASDARARFIFTELGYRSRKGATAAPWDEGPRRRARPRRAAARVRGVPARVGDGALRSTASTSGTGTATAARARPATRRAASRPRTKCDRCSARFSPPAPASRTRHPPPGPLPGPRLPGLPAHGNQLPRGARAAARSHPICRLVCAPSRVNRRRFTRAGAPVFRILMRSRSDRTRSDQIGSDQIGSDRIESDQIGSDRIRSGSGKNGATEGVNRLRFTRGGAQTRAWQRHHRGPGVDGARNEGELSRERRSGRTAAAIRRGASAEASSRRPFPPRSTTRARERRHRHGQVHRPTACRRRRRPP